MAQSLEQMVRDILEQAIADGLVARSRNFTDPDPQCRTSGELVGCANVLADALRENRKERATR